MTRETLERLAAAEAKATKGPWTAENVEVREDGSPGCAWGIASESVDEIVVLHDFVGPADAELIAAMRNALPELIHLARLGLAVTEMRRDIELLSPIDAHDIDVKANLLDPPAGSGR